MGRQTTEKVHRSFLFVFVHPEAYTKLPGISPNLLAGDRLALRCEVQAGHQHQDLEFHTATHNIKAIFGMHHRYGADHDDNDD